MTPELHRPIAADRIGPCGLEVTVQADVAECTALAQRMGLPAVQSLSCRFELARKSGHTITSRGHLCARIVQTCVVSLEDFAAEVEERFLLRFVPEGQETDKIDPADPEDEVGYTAGMLDLGEAAAEQLSLALDPFPRRPGAALPETEPGVVPHPFDVLRRH